MTLAPGEQRALLRMERSLGRDRALTTVLRAFGCPCCEQDSPLEELSPWHPFLWRAVPAALIALTLLAAALIIGGALGVI
ncbi:MAG TPA: hypothetical protein VG164_03980 [Trebonia sp.]|jgi:hypothetical protein|nr:hypothetical protein [Trebonia sp.]